MLLFRWTFQNLISRILGKGGPRYVTNNIRIVFKMAKFLSNILL